jgi:hypothetical protein
MWFVQLLPLLLLLVVLLLLLLVVLLMLLLLLLLLVVLLVLLLVVLLLLLIMLLLLKLLLLLLYELIEFRNEAFGESLALKRTGDKDQGADVRVNVCDEDVTHHRVLFLVFVHRQQGFLVREHTATTTTTIAIATTVRATAWRIEDSVHCASCDDELLKGHWPH